MTTGGGFWRLLLLGVVCIVAACGEDNDKIGTTVKGTRVAIIEQAKTLTADPNLASGTPHLPRAIVTLSWPQVGYDAEHAMPAVDFAATPRVVWEKSIGDGSDSDFKLLAHPVLAQGVVYTMDAQGVVQASDAHTGDTKWEYDTTPKDSEDHAIGGGLAVDGNSLYATTGFGRVVAINAKTGKVRWDKALLKPLRAAPTLADNRVYVVTLDNDLNALDARTGEVLWHQSGIAESATLMGAASPSVNGDSVVVAYNSGEIFDLRVQNGRSLWNYSLTTPAQVGALPAIADIRGLPVIDHGRIYAISHSGRMAAIEQRSGERVWEADIGGIDTPVVAGDAVFVYGGDGQLMALARESGRVMWIVPLPKLADPADKDSDRLVWTGPVLAGGRLWMVNSLGKLSGFSPDNGAPVAVVDLGHPVYLSPIVVDRTMYIAADDGTLLALR